jgi:peptide/nickel transport system substrate-binding protein
MVRASDPGSDVRIRPFVALSTLLLVVVLAGCTEAPTVVRNSSVTVATSQAFFSYNDKTSYGDSAANTAIVEATNSSFNHYEDSSRLVPDPSFGSYQLLSNDPLTVKYTIRDGVTWSDGVPVDAADMLLAWAANSGALNTPGFDASKYVDHQTGRFTTDFPKDVVYFDGATSDGLQYVTKTPTIGDDGRSITLVYDRFFVDWRLVFEVGLPAHVLARHALGLTGESAAAQKAAVIDAIRHRKTDALAALSRFWNSGFNLSAMPRSRDLLVSTGPYRITGFVADDHVTLTTNPHYSGADKPTIEKVTVRFITDPLSQVEALRDGSADVVVPQPGAEVARALHAVPGATVIDGLSGEYEHLDLQFANGRSNVFANPLVREAFLRVVPREQILDQLVTPVQAQAELRSSQLFPLGSPGYARSVSANGSSAYETVDVSAAKALLATAKVSSPAVCILFDRGNPRRLKEFQLIQASAAQAGFVVTDCSSADWVSLLGAPGAYDAALFAWKVSNLSVTGARDIFATKAIRNYNFYSNPQVDSLLRKLEVTEDATQQLRLRADVDRLHWADGYGVPLYQFPVLVATDARVDGVAPSALSAGILWNLWQWKPAESR